jgi:valyl-tRNA synthetase
MREFRLGESAHLLYDFFWNDFCDWYVELAKIQLGANEELKVNTQRILRYVLDMSMRLLHPIMPHLTEEIWQQLSVGEALIVAEFPQYREDLVFPTEAKQMELVFETIRALRNVRQSFNISAKIDIQIFASADEKPVFEAIEAYIKRLAKVENISYDGEAPKQSASAVVSASKIVIPLAGLIDLDAELARQQKKLEKLSAEKTGLAGRLNNESFKANKPELWEQTRARVEEIELQENAIKELMKSLED